MTGRHRVAVADRSIGAVDHDLSAARVTHNLASSVNRLTLRVDVDRGTVSFGCDNVPTAVGIWDDMSFVARHERSFRVSVTREIAQLPAETRLWQL